MKPRTKPHAAAAALTIAALTAATAAQAPQASESTGPAGGAPRTAPVPVNLKVLPRTWPPERVQGVMEEWSQGLGIHCDSCHAEDREKTGPEGRPLLDFASDAKPMKAVARAMFSMTETINGSYLAKMDNSGVPVTCGTCHRGRLEPDVFRAPGEKPAAQAPPPEERSLEPE